MILANVAVARELETTVAIGMRLTARTARRKK